MMKDVNYETFWSHALPEVFECFVENPNNFSSKP